LSPDDNRVLTSRNPTRRAAFSTRPAAFITTITMAGLICALYLADLTGMGLVSADEPRYADIGRAMARTGDWVTPRLWGHPWFEKPALLYWMTASGFRLGLGPDLAPRLPVALLSLSFLVFFWWRLRIEWGNREAFFGTAMLATSVGWLAYSHVAVTDLPLAVFFSAAVLLSLPWIARHERTALPAAAACLGLAALAKGLVPLVLFVPVLAMGWWRNPRDSLRPLPVLAFAVVALPWYILCALRNGSEFPRVLFVQQTFARVGSAALQHGQPFWFYGPVLLLLLYPWFPLLIYPGRGLELEIRDPRIRVLAAVIVFGFVFFSAVLNKLPGYLLPLIPEAFALLGIGLAHSSRPATAIVAPVILLGALPMMTAVAPAVLAHGLRAVNIPWEEAIVWMIAAGVLGGILAWAMPRYALASAAAIAAAAFLWFQIVAFPRFDSAASARPLWRGGHPQCAPQATRSELYGLYYYAERELPPCNVLDRGLAGVVR
jgi:4-amino-4-deoxy-L-arabinose transferase-like glycosyltransferase